MSGEENNPVEPLVEPLTRREHEVLGLLAQGFSAPEIAESLTLAVSSVKFHIQHLYGKLGVNSKRQALTRAQALGLLTPGTPAPRAAAEPASLPEASGSAAGPPTNLPVQLTQFIGRDKELADVKRLLASQGPGAARLVTLTGPGGTGKTRLALQGAAGLPEYFPDGIWLVELAPIADPALAPQTAAQALGLRDDTGRPLLQVLAQRLRGQTLLLILDNCEHLIAACAELAEQLLRAAPGLRILATSREPLGLAGESTYPVPALSLPNLRPLPASELLAASEAVQLFVERATAARPDFALTEANAPAVAQICRRLDGIPLALELAAVRIRALPVEQIAERLDDRLRLLAGGSRTAPARQQTLRGAIDWSYTLLSEAERALLRRLAVFAGGCSLEAAEHVAGGTGDVLDLLTQLVGKSLVRSEQRPGQAARFGMLETIREYAQEKLAEAGEAEAVQGRHLAFYRALAETAAPELRRHGQLEWLKRLDQENDNLRAALSLALKQEDAESALRLAGALFDFWWIRGYGVEGYRWLEAALNLPASNSALARSAWRARALRDAAWGAGPGTVDSAVAQSRLEESLSIYRELGNQAGMARALTELASRRPLPSDSAAALRLYEEALELYTAVEDGWGIGLCLCFTAKTLDALGDRAKARELSERSAAFLRAAGDRWWLMLALDDLARQSWLDGDATRALALLEENLAAFEELAGREENPAASDELAGRLGSYWTLAYLFEISIAQGNYVQAREAALAVQKLRGIPRDFAVGQIRLGQLTYFQGRLAEAQAHFEASLKIFRELNDPSGMGWVPPWLGCVAYRAGDLDEARALVEAGLAIHDPDGVPEELAFALLSRGDVARAQGEPVAAARLYARSLRIMVEHGDQPDVAERLEGFAKLSAGAGEPQRAARLFGAAEALRERIGTPVSPVEQADHNLLLAQTRGALDQSAFDTAWAEGLAMSWEQAAAYALET